MTLLVSDSVFLIRKKLLSSFRHIVPKASKINNQSNIPLSKNIEWHSKTESLFNFMKLLWRFSIVPFSKVQEDRRATKQFALISSQNSGWSFSLCSVNVTLGWTIRVICRSPCSGYLKTNRKSSTRRSSRLCSARSSSRPQSSSRSPWFGTEST